MFFNNFMPKPTFGSSGSRKSGGRSRADRKGAGASLTSFAPKSSPVPRFRPKSVKSKTTSHSGPNMDGSAGYTRTTSSNSSGAVGKPVIKTSRGDSVTANGNRGMRIGNTIYNNPANPSNVKKSALNDANGVGRRNAPVNVAVDKSSDTAAGGSSSGNGGASGKIKASKAQEDNLTVRRKSRGTAKYQLNKSARNPLVVSKQNKRNT